MSWLRGGAQEWNSQFRDTLSRAASSVQRFAEQAELQHLGEQFLASAQTLAEQSEAALSNVADKVTGGVSSLGLTSEDSPKRSGDLAQRFVREAKQLESAGGTRLMVAEVAEVLHTWQERLSAPGKGSTSALKALLQSQALHIALTDLTRSRAGRAVLSAAAGEQGRWFSLIWSIVLLGFTAYVFESFLGGWLASQRQVLGKCLDGRPAGDAWSTAEFSIRPRALSFKEKWEPSTETPEINCHFPVFVYRCPSWASLDSFEECKAGRVNYSNLQ
ncbi:unnamed protein product [Effrenium voratum]|nr:unnamed protein product [Effrenium voratum]